MELQIRTQGRLKHVLPVVLLHGGPGLPDYLGPVAAMIDDLTLVHRYDQRGVGGSSWEGEHTLDLHLKDLDGLLDRWGYDKVVLVGHSYGTDLAARYCLRHPARLAGLVLVAGPFVEPWRDSYRLNREQRRSDTQRARLAELGAAEHRTESEEQELLTLAWFADHYDQARGWSWAAEAARTRRPINWAMNRQLGAERRRCPLEERIDDLASAVPAATSIIGGAGDPRPANALVRLGRQLARPVVVIPEAGHEPWLEQPEPFRRELRSAVLHSASQNP